MTANEYTKDWMGALNLGQGKTLDELKTIFGDNITNIDDSFVDTNYKSILVTFNIVDGKAQISRFFEAYNENGVFLGVKKITCVDY